jgi:protein SCO1/2
MRRVRMILWVAVAIAGLVALTLALRPAAAPQASISTTMAKLGGPFTLTGSDGQPFSSARLAGRPYAIFFGFTHCPDVCPTTLARLARLSKALGPDDTVFERVFISVDPERDKPADMARFSALFGTPIIGLTGSPEEIERVKKLYGIYSKKVPLPGGDYSVDHTATVLLFDRRGHFTSTIATDEGDGPALEKLRALTA